MRLLGLEIRGFRRFLKADIDLDIDPVAVIGRNEAGKSSLLAALTRLNDSGPIDRHDRTRGHSFSEGASVLKAWFALDVDDKAAIGHIPELAGASRYIVTKTMDGKVGGEFHPPVVRDLSARRKALTLLERVARTVWYESSELDADEFEAVRGLLADRGETLARDQLDALGPFAAQLPSHPPGSIPATLRRQLAGLVEVESRQSPTLQAADILLPRRPQFVLFEPEHRDPQSVYDLAVSATNPPPALANIASLAGLSLDEVLQAHQHEDYGRLERLQRDANLQLQEYFSSAWRQSSMHVQIRIDKNELRFLVDNLQGDLTSIDERSAGLQTFVALVAFLASEDTDRPPVVLIDEAETHLHYDAQADLVRVLSEQDAAAKVIYTTHSAGCLPLDLGLGVRAVAAQPDDVSRIENSVWELGPGLSPILLAMGASVLAFSRARRAIVGEGASESQLLPALLREAVPADEVDYQVAPGVASATEEAIADLDLEAVAVGYVLDGDKGGREHAKRLKAVGIPESRITFLGGSPTSRITLEDLVSREAYQAGVNAVLEAWQPGQAIPLSGVPATGRALALAKWCKKRGFAPPDKKRIAARLLAMRGNARDNTDGPRALTTTASRRTLQRLHRDVRRMLDVVPRASGGEPATEANVADDHDRPPP